jgi:hypothetical protein
LQHSMTKQFKIEMSVTMPLLVDLACMLVFLFRELTMVKNKKKTSAFRVVIVPARWDVAWLSLAGIAFRPPFVMILNAWSYLDASTRTSLGGYRWWWRCLPKRRWE